MFNEQLGKMEDEYNKLLDIEKNSFILDII